MQWVTSQEQNSALSFSWLSLEGYAGRVFVKEQLHFRSWGKVSNDSDSFQEKRISSKMLICMQGTCHQVYLDGPLTCSTKKWWRQSLPSVTIANTGRQGDGGVWQYSAYSIRSTPFVFLFIPFYYWILWLIKRGCQLYLLENYLQYITINKFFFFFSKKCYGKGLSTLVGKHDF